MDEGLKSRSKTTETSISILHALMAHDGATIEELSELLGLAPSTVHRHLVTLREHTFVSKRGETYAIGLQFLTFGGYAQRQVTAFPMIKNTVDELTEHTGERAQFIVEEEGERVYLYTETGRRSVNTGTFIGKRGEIHTSAAGKVILGALPDSRGHPIVVTGAETHAPEARVTPVHLLGVLRGRGRCISRRGRD